MIEKYDVSCNGSLTHTDTEKKSTTPLRRVQAAHNECICHTYHRIVFESTVLTVDYEDRNQYVLDV